MANVPLSEYKGVWLFVLFDLPVKTRENRKDYADFRKHLLRLGFSRLQLSVYARYYRGEPASEAQRRQIRGMLPPGGHVRLVTITDRQFGKMEIFYGGRPRTPEQPPEQLLLF